MCSPAINIQFKTYIFGTTEGLNIYLLTIGLIALFDSTFSVTWLEKAYNLPSEHLPFVFSKTPMLAKECEDDSNCPYKMHLNKDVCWGYEVHCTDPIKRYSSPRCAGDIPSWLASRQEQIDSFYHQGDFGYVRKQIEELKYICTPKSQRDSSLECSHYFKFCRGSDIMIDFKFLDHVEPPMRYKMDLLQPGMIGGHCDVQTQFLSEHNQHKSPLQSWFPELQTFAKLASRPSENETLCDTTFTKPTFILKLDATVNMYHHFCDFVNLYASLHVNGSFSMDNQILLWDTMPYASKFGVVWRAFTHNPVLDIHQFKSQTVCFRDLVLPLLPRMIFGLYYNMPLIDSCENSGLIHAFNRHILHKLNIKHIPATNAKVRITFLARESQFRNVMNENDLLDTLRQNPDYIVKRVVYSGLVPFSEQLQITQNSDVFIGMHGAGLTHVLFLPDWAVLFELYHCEDQSCYKDLARLRGVNYITWSNSSLFTREDEGHHPTLGAHAKFTNYAFDAHEFVRLVDLAANHVMAHPSWRALYEDDIMTWNGNNHDDL